MIDTRLVRDLCAVITNSGRFSSSTLGLTGSALAAFFSFNLIDSSAAILNEKLFYFCSQVSKHKDDISISLG